MGWSPDAEKAAELDASTGNTEGEDIKAGEAAEEPAHATNGMPEESKPDPASAPATEEAPQTYEEQLGQLDLQLTYLWRVHGVDYYAGIEHAEPEAYDACASSKRMLRCTRPEEGEQPIKEEGANFLNACLHASSACLGMPHFVVFHVQSRAHQSLQPELRMLASASRGGQLSPVKVQPHTFALPMQRTSS